MTQPLMPLRRTKKEDRTPQEHVLVENVEELQAEANNWRRKLERLFVKQAAVRGADIPVRPRPALPDLSALYELDYELEPKIVLDARARLLDLQEQLSLILIKIGGMPTEIEEVEAKLAQTGSADDAGRALFLEREQKALETHRLPKLQKEIEDAQDAVVVAEGQARLDAFDTLSQEVDEIDAKILEMLRGALVLRIRGRVLRAAANGLVSSTGRTLYDWLAKIWTFTDDVSREITGDDLYAFEQRIIEQTPERYWHT